MEFESSTYIVNENAGQVEVCVIVTSHCPVAHDFSLVLVNVEYSAGKILLVGIVRGNFHSTFFR